MDRKITPAQLRVAYALALEHGHEWALALARAEGPGGVLARFPDGATPEEIAAYTVERRASFSLPGIEAPTLVGGYPFSGIIVHRTGDGRGRLEWEIAYDGGTVLRIHRPHGVAMTVFLSPSYDGEERTIDFHVGNVGFEGRHWEALRRAIDAILASDRPQTDPTTD